jgi:hypothetical protein
MSKTMNIIENDLIIMLDNSTAEVFVCAPVVVIVVLVVVLALISAPS